jgi:hypothetical protein
VLVEYQLPLTSKRADVVLCGVHPRTRQPSYVVVELKQWSSASLLEDSIDLCVVPAYGGARLHPGEQVRRYCGHLGDFLATLADLDDPLAGVAYLHNVTDLEVEELFRLPEDEQGRLFTGQRRAEFLDYLKGRLAPASGAEAADRLLGSAVCPSRQLLALAAAEVQRREIFRLQDRRRRRTGWCCGRWSGPVAASPSRRSSWSADRGRARASSRCRCSASCRGRAGRCCTRPGRRRSPRRCARRRASGHRG